MQTNPKSESGARPTRSVLECGSPLPLSRFRTHTSAAIPKRPRAGAPGGDAAKSWSQGRSIALDLGGSTTILNSVFKSNRATGGVLGSLTKSNLAQNLIWSSCPGGAITSLGGGPEIRETSVVENQVMADNGVPGDPLDVGLGSGITMLSGMPGTPINCPLLHNTVAGAPGVAVVAALRFTTRHRLRRDGP